MRRLTSFGLMVLLGAATVAALPRDSQAANKLQTLPATSSPSPTPTPKPTRSPHIQQSQHSLGLY